MSCNDLRYIDLVNNGHWDYSASRIVKKMDSQFKNLDNNLTSEKIEELSYLFYPSFCSQKPTIKQIVETKVTRHISSNKSEKSRTPRWAFEDISQVDNQRPVDSSPDDLQRIYVIDQQNCSPLEFSNEWLEWENTFQPKFSHHVTPYNMRFDDVYIPVSEKWMQLLRYHQFNLKFVNQYPDFDILGSHFRELLSRDPLIVQQNKREKPVISKSIQDVLIDEILDFLYEKGEDHFSSFFKHIQYFQLCLKSLKFETQYKFLKLLKTILINDYVYFNSSINYMFSYFKLFHINNKDKTKANIMRFNNKIYLHIQDSYFASRPLEVKIEKGEEQWGETYIPQQVETLINNFSDAATNLSATSDFVRNSIPRMVNAADSVAAFSDILPTLTETLESITKLAQSSHETLDNINPILNKTVKDSLPMLDIFEKLKTNWLPLAACITQISNSKSVVDLSCSIIILLNLLGIDSLIVEKVKNFFSKQAVEQDSLLNNKALMCFLFSFLGKYSPLAIVSDFTKYATQSAKDIKALEEMYELFAEVLSSWGFDISSKAKNISELRKDLEQVLAKVTKYETICATETALFCKDEYFMEFMDSFRLLESIKNKIDTNCYASIRNSNFAQDLMSLNNRFLKMKTLVDQARRSNGKRVETTAFLLLGEKGIGKSQLLGQLPRKVYNYYKKHYKDHQDEKIRKRFEFMEFVKDGPVWNQNTSDDFHQGYIGQMIHMNDDMFKSTTDQDHEDFLNFVSPIIFLTRQAELSQKGFSYNAVSFWGSSNKFPKTSKKIYNLDALQRRFEVITVTVRPGMQVPRGGDFDHSFKWLQFSAKNGGDQHNINIKGQDVTLDQICEAHLNMMANRYQMYETSNKDEEQAAIELDPESLKNVYLKENFVETFTEMLRGTPRERKIAKSIAVRRVEVNGKVLPILEASTEDPAYAFSHNMFFLLAESVQHNEKLELDLNFLVKDVNGDIYCFNTLEKQINTVINSRDFWHKFDYNTRLETFEIEGPWYDVILVKLLKLYIHFSPLISKFGKIGHFVGWVVNPIYETIVSTIAYIYLVFMNTEFGKEKLLRNQKLGFYFEMFYSLSGYVNYIPLIVSIIALIIYKTKKFSMEKTCDRCTVCVDEKVLRFSRIFCTAFCEGCMSKTHSKECEELPFYTSYLLREKCDACLTKTCDSECCHCIPVEDIDYKKLAYYKYWFEYVFPVEEGDEIFIENRRSGPPRGARSISKRMQEESPSGLRQKKVRNQFKQEESPSGQYQKKVQHRFQEESPSGQYQKKVQHRFQESSDKYIPPAFRQPVSLSEELTEDHERIDKSKEEVSVIDKLKVSSALEKPDFATFMNNYEEYDLNGHSPGSAKKDKINLAFQIGMEQYTEDEAARNIYAALSKASIRCYRVRDGASSAFLYGHGFDNYVVTPAHLFPRTPIECKFKFTAPSGKEIEMFIVDYDRTRDVALWTFDKKQGYVFPRRYYDNLITNKEFIQLSRKESTVLQHLPLKNILQVVTASVVTHHVIDLSVVGLQEYEHLFEIKAQKTLPPLTTAGDCGGIIVLYDTNYVRKILGFHVVGTGECAYAAITTKELIDKMLNKKPTEEQGEIFLVDQPYSKFPIVDILNQVENEVVGCQSKNFPQGEFHYIGELGFFAKPAADTGLKTHPFYGQFEEKSKPANLHVNQVKNRDLLLKDENGEPNLLISRTSKYGKKFKNIIDPSILRNMQSQLQEYYLDEFKGKDLSSATEDEILNGQEYNEHSHPLDMRTSPGVPWSGTGSGAGKKKDFFCCMKSEQNSLGHNVLKRYLDMEKKETQLLKEVIDRTDALGKKGIRTLSIIKDCLKDECRPLDKVWKPRVFKAFPLEKVYLLRKYTLKFKTEWTIKRERMFHAVGINVMSPEWTNLYHLLKEKSNFGGDADFGTFDGNLRPEFMQVASDIIVNTILAGTSDKELQREGCTREEYKNILDVLLDENIRTISVSGKTVYMDQHGNPSGSPLTTVMNCMVNFLYHWYCFIKITKFNCLGKFLQNVSFHAFGDDVIFSANPETGYTFEAISKIMIEELEQDYTDAAKELNGKNKKIEELTFLKRKFKVISNQTVYAPIVTESIEQRFNWTQIHPTDYKTHYENIEEGYIEAAMHTTEYFNYFKKCVKAGIIASHFDRNPLFSSLKYVSYQDYVDILDARYRGTSCLKL